MTGEKGCSPPMRKMTIPKEHSHSGDGNQGLVKGLGKISLLTIPFPMFFL
jgi:hypothetical protein